MQFRDKDQLPLITFGDGNHLSLKLLISHLFSQTLKHIAISTFINIIKSH